jgi:Leucine-rich repeat (LRR) protein
MQRAKKIIDEWIKQNDPSKTLYLAYLKLTELPEIPPNCKELHCNNNNLTSLPVLPNCEVLYCFQNQLTVLPELPNCDTLFCAYNQLTVLPELPKCRVLYCYANQLTFLPELPNCHRALYCGDNRLLVLPNFAQRPYDLNYQNNPYLWISKRQSRKLRIKETPNYPRYAQIIQRNYRKYIIRKSKLLYNYISKDTSKVVCLYL